MRTIYLGKLEWRYDQNCYYSRYFGAFFDKNLLEKAGNLLIRLKDKPEDWFIKIDELPLYILDEFVTDFNVYIPLTILDQITREQ